MNINNLKDLFTYNQDIASHVVTHVHMQACIMVHAAHLVPTISNIVSQLKIHR